MMNGKFLDRGSHVAPLRREQRATFRREVQIASAAAAITLVSILGFLVDGAARLAGLLHRDARAEAGELILLRGVIALLLLSAFIYQLTRVGYLKRLLRHRPAPARALERITSGASPTLAILVPSYQEETRVVRRTLLSAALQPVPHRRVVLLLDDPAEPSGEAEAARLEATRALVRDIDAGFAKFSARFGRALARYQQRRARGHLDPEAEIRRLASSQRAAAEELERRAAETPVLDHNDALFVDRILWAPAECYRARADALSASGDAAGVQFPLEYQRLATLFAVELTSFQRKRYANLSHEPNKAMNLNSYIALMGRSFREVESAEGRRLEEAHDCEATLRVPASDLLLVLDADSVILPEYSPRLVHYLCRPENARVAVVQTPYASVPGAESIERIAGATTDIQLMAHQGSTLFGAGSWVGASALVRREALEEIAHTVEERGHPVRIYIRDRTLNEDTDTTVDLIRRGWTVHNYPDRLAYSATPPDFGSLVIQRRRWATGGILILPNVIRYLRDRPSPGRLWEVTLRANYILSAPLGSAGILLLLVSPAEAGWCAWALPAFGAWLFAFQRDLMHSGHRAADLFRTLALNAMLLPVNLAGALHSVRQIWTGRKVPFQRTPKVEGRTSARAVHIGAQLALLLLTGTQALARFSDGDWTGGLFHAAYAASFGYAFHSFIGWGCAVEDCLGRFAARAWRPAGSRDGGRGPRRHAPAPAVQRSRPPVRSFAGRVSRVAAVVAALVAFTLGYAFFSATVSLIAVERPPREAAVTFDDLPVISVTPLDAEARRGITAALLDGIASLGIPAIGFVNEYGLYGFQREIAGAPDPAGVALLQMWLDAGHELGNHTFAHTDLHAATVAIFQQDILRGEEVTRRLFERMGRRPLYFRHPYLHTGRDLATRREVERFLAERGYRVAPVTVDNEDWLFAAAYSRAAARGDAAMMRRVGEAYVQYTELALDYSERLSAELFGREIKHVVLLHANALNAAYFDDVARSMKERGYRFIALDAALADGAYASEDTYTGPESLNWLARWAVTRDIRRAETVLDDFPEVPAFVQAEAAIGAPKVQ